MKEVRFPLRNESFKYENEVPKMIVLNTLLAKKFGRSRFRVKKCSKIKPSKLFEHPKYLQYSIKLCSSSKALSFPYSGPMERNLVETLLDLCNGWIELVLFSRQSSRKTSRLQ